MSQPRRVLRTAAIAVLAVVAPINAVTIGAGSGYLLAIWVVSGTVGLICAAILISLDRHARLNAKATVTPDFKAEPDPPAERPAR